MPRWPPPDPGPQPGSPSPHRHSGRRSGRTGWRWWAGRVPGHRPPAAETPPAPVRPCPGPARQPGPCPCPRRYRGPRSGSPCPRWPVPPRGSPCTPRTGPLWDRPGGPECGLFPSQTTPHAHIAAGTAYPGPYVPSCRLLYASIPRKALVTAEPFRPLSRSRIRKIPILIRARSMGIRMSGSVTEVTSMTLESPTTRRMISVPA